MKNALIIGSGLGGLSTALRLSSLGYQVTILEKHHSAGGRLNRLEMDGFRFDLGPTFMSMSYELDELFGSCGMKMPLEMIELDPLYTVFFDHHDQPFKVWKNLAKLAEEFSTLEPDLEQKAERYLKRAAQFFHDTDDRVIKRNFNGLLDYAASLRHVPLKHLPFLFKSMWSGVEEAFESDEVRMIFSLVAFFLGSTPFKTPLIYSMLSYTEFQHDGYWKVKGGMYALVECLIKILEDKNVKIVYNTEVQDVYSLNGSLKHVIDQKGQTWAADLFVANADAAAFRGQILKRKKFSPERLDRMDWTLAPFTLYIGVNKPISALGHHNYFLRNNFRDYANKVFTSSVTPDKPYYYVNVPSKSDPSAAPAGCETVFILCPVPDLRIKKDWSDQETFADGIVDDLSQRINFDIRTNTKVRKVLTPNDWQGMFNLYQGSGLGLAHGMNQVGIFRPKNKDEELKNLYYVGASTIPGTGLPMVIISSKLVTERIKKDFKG